MDAYKRGQILGRILLNASVAAALGTSLPVPAQPGHNLTIVASRELKIGGGTLQVDFAAGAMDLSQDAVFAHVQARGFCNHHLLRSLSR